MPYVEARDAWECCGTTMRAVTSVPMMTFMSPEAEAEWRKANADSDAVAVRVWSSNPSDRGRIMEIPTLVNGQRAAPTLVAIEVDGAPRPSKPKRPRRTRRSRR